MPDSVSAHYYLHFLFPFCCLKAGEMMVIIYCLFLILTKPDPCHRSQIYYQVVLKYCTLRKLINVMNQWNSNIFKSWKFRGNLQVLSMGHWEDMNISFLKPVCLFCKCAGYIRLYQKCSHADNSNYIVGIISIINIYNVQSSERDFYIESEWGTEDQFVLRMWQAVTPMSCNGVKTSC